MARVIAAGIVTSAAGVLMLVMGGTVPVVNSRRAASLFAAFLPICVGACMVLAVVRSQWIATESSETP